MSLSNPPSAPPTMFPTVQTAVDHAMQQVGPYLEGLLHRSAPSAPMMKALGDELVRAQNDPRGVAHPELLDPDAFWAKQAWPQAAAVVKNARSALLAIADELVQVVQGSEQVLDGWLVTQVDATLSRPDVDAEAARDRAIDAVVGHCEALHRLVGTLGRLAPTHAHLVAPREVVDGARREEAARRAATQREVESRTVTEEHRAAFERAWAEGFERDVAVRDQELRSVLPFRHQELLILAHEKAADAIAEDIDAMVQELTEPILGIGERLVRRYDELASGGLHAAAPSAPPVWQ